VLAGEAGIEALEALGTLADRLAHRASATTKQVEVVARYGVRFTNVESRNRIRVCYDGDAFRRVLAMRARPEQQARAALALTRQECTGGALQPLERKRMDEWRVDMLDRVDADALPGYLKNRVRMRRASVLSSLAYQRARQGESAEAASNRALAELVRINKSELAHEDARSYDEAAMRVSATRWASSTRRAAAKPGQPYAVTVPGEPGQTCVLLMGEKRGNNPLVRRCTYGVVWPSSAQVNREGTALALAVQPTDAWLELWIFYRSAQGWKVHILPPAAMTPEVGYAEFAGWVPGGTQLLVAREALSAGRHKRTFELLRVASLTTVRQASDPSMLGAFQRWQDASWKRHTLSMR
jgi:hypothetical protein